MATPITWQSISKPDFESVNKGLLQTAALFSNAFDGFKDTLKESNATVEQNWKQGKENNTNALLNKFAGFKTAEEAQAALESGAVAEMLGGYGAQVDGSAVRAAQQNLVGNLQKKANEADTYQQAQLAVQERDPIGQAQVLINSGNYDGLNEFLKTAGLSSPTQAILLSDAEKHKVFKDKVEQDKQKFTNELLNGESERNYRLANVVTQQDANNVQRLQVLADTEREERKLEDARRKEHAAQLKEDKASQQKKGLYGSGSLDTAEGRASFIKIMREDLLMPDNAIEDVIDNFYDKFRGGVRKYTIKGKDGKTRIESLPIPVNTAVESVAANPDKLGNGSLWSRRGDTAKTSLERKLDDANFYNNEWKPAVRARDLEELERLSGKGQNVRNPVK